MDAIYSIELIRDQVSGVEKQGGTAISTKDLSEYLNRLEKSIELSENANQLSNEIKLVNHSAYINWDTSLFHATIDAGKSALNSIIIINGGAVIALMSVMSSLVDGGKGDNLASSLAISLLLFGIGVLAGSVGFCSRYISQAFFTHDHRQPECGYKTRANIFLALSVLSALTGLVIFGVGVFGAFEAFSEFNA